jgi:hypothetical protein
MIILLALTISNISWSQSSDESNLKWPINSDSPSTLKKFDLLNSNLTLSQTINISQSLTAKCTNNYINFYHHHLGLFCKAENKIQASGRIPFKFRLGSVQYVDWLESKPHTQFNFH